MVVAVGTFFVGCYNDYDNPAPAKVYTDEDFSNLEYWSIKDLMDMFYEKYPDNSGIGKSITITEDAYTRGKVISNDRYGNVYKTLYIYDEQTESAIQLKLNTGNYLFYPVGQMVYVKLKDLVLGNYRTMLSIGVASSNPDYANDNIESSVLLKRHIFSGEQLKMTAADTLVVTKDNYREVLTDAALGRLVRFEGLESKYGKAKWGYENNFPNYFANSQSFDVTSPGWEDIYDWATWAATRRVTIGSSFETVYYYGSAWFTYDAQTEADYVPGNYVVRTSGYSSFRDNRIPADGAIVDITALYTKFTNASGAEYSTAYQLVLNTDRDVVVREE